MSRDHRSIPRLYAPAAAAPGQVVRLPDEEARHLTRVLRRGRGDAVSIIDGRGGAFEGVVAETGRGGASVMLGAVSEAAPEARVAVTLALAVLKGDHMDQVVRDAVMLGVAAVQPLVTSRTEIGLAALARSRRRERWTRVAIASVKQCGRAVVPPIFEPCVLDALPQAVAEGTLRSPVLTLVEPGAGREAETLAGMERAAPPAATLVVGPEGGWTSEELDLASRTGRLVTLGGRTIRADATPAIALAALYAIWGEF